MKSMKPLLKSSDLKGARRTCSRLFCLGVAATMALATSVPSALGQGRTPADLENTDIKYPCFLNQATGQRFWPNDVEVVCYGPELQASDVISTWNTDIVYRGTRLNWGGTPQITVVTSFNDPQNPSFPGNGMNCVSVRWSGPARPELGPVSGPGLGQYVHIGVHFKPTAGIVHCEIWWTVNGVRVANVCDPKLTFICSTSTTTCCIENPYSVPLYIYGCRFFRPTILPRLTNLVYDIQPQQFGAANGWTIAPAPAPVICLQPWCRIYIKIPGPTTWTPVVFQIGSSFTNLVTLAPDGGPNRDDPGTAAIKTVRSGVIRQADANGDGVVGTPDFNIMRQEYGLPNPDLVP